MARITIKGVKGIGTNLKRTTKKMDIPKKQRNAFTKKRVILLLKLRFSFFGGCFFFVDVIFVAICFIKSENFYKSIQTLAFFKIKFETFLPKTFRILYF